MQQQVWLIPARWWPDTLPEFKSEGWWQRPQTRVKFRQCRCGSVENPSLRSDKYSMCEDRMLTEGKRLDGILCTDADPRYAGKLDDPQGGVTTMLMQHVREDMTVN